MRTRTILAAVLGMSLVSYRMVDDSAAVSADALVAQPSVDTPVTGTSTTAAESGEAGAAASNAANAPESDTSSSAAPASLSVDTAATGAPQGDAAADPTPTVTIDVEDHAEARERFAGLLARLHNAEEDFVHALRNELNAIGTLLHLHSVASGKADTTGDYSSSDLS